MSEKYHIQILFDLLILYQIKHFLCDYPLQTPYMLGKFKAGNKWIKPLIAHAGVHFIGTFCIVVALTPKLAPALAAIDFLIHFFIDRVKASPNLGGKWEAISKAEYPTIAALAKGELALTNTSFVEYQQKKVWANQKLKSNKWFWWALGMDQMAHHLTHYMIIAIVMANLQ